MLFTAYFNCYQTLLGRSKSDRSRLWMLTKNTHRKQDSSAAILTAICNKRQVFLSVKKFLEYYVYNVHLQVSHMVIPTCILKYKSCLPLILERFPLSTLKIFLNTETDKFFKFKQAQR